MVGCAVGFAFDAGSGGKELTGVFSALYVTGCVAAVLAVRQAAVFTAVIQPPLVLFVVVPGAYYLMRGDDIHGIKDVLINCGYPLIERFPLMFFTSATVLLVGLARWYFGKSARRTAPSTEARVTGGRLSAKLSSLLGGGGAIHRDRSRRRQQARRKLVDEARAAGVGRGRRRAARGHADGGAGRAPGAEPPDREPRRRHSADRRPHATPAPAAARAARGARPAKRAGTPSRSRHARPPDTEIIEPVADVDRPRRRRPRPSEPPPPPVAEPRRRPRASSGREPRGSVPPSERRAAYERAERRERDRLERPQRRSRYDGWPGSAERGDYEPLEPHGPAGSGSHHPISRVRYRGDDGSEDRTEHRTRRRAPRDDADRWEYDI